jgi:hypothetical protein
MWAPSIVIAVVALGSIDLSSILTVQRYVLKTECERDIKTAVAAMTRLYPTLQVKFAGCVPAR